jgi:prepilin-type N-terminal cleavage/methylation domain-containing protein
MLDVSAKMRRLPMSGFTLVELLVAMAILLIVAAVTLEGFRDYARVQQYNRFVEEVGRSLQVARQQTLGSKEDTVYGVYVGTNTVEIFTGATPIVGSAANTIFNFNPDIFVATTSLSGGAWFVTFKRVTGEPSATGTILIYSTELGKTATYTLHASGLIE